MTVLGPHWAVAAYEDGIETGRLQARVGAQVGAIVLHAELFEGGALDGLPHGDDDKVGGQTHLRLVGRHWGRAAAAHRADALGLADERRRAALRVRFNAGRRLKAAHFHALHHGRLHLGGQRGHVLQAASIGHGDRGGHRRARRCERSPWPHCRRQ